MTTSVRAEPETQQRQSVAGQTRQDAGIAVQSPLAAAAQNGVQSAAQRALDSRLNGSRRMSVQRMKMAALSAEPAQLAEAEGGAGHFAGMMEAGADPHSMGLVAAQPQGEALQSDAAQVYQLAAWKDHGATKLGAIWYFKDEATARIALTAELGSSATYIKEADWELGLRFATDREEGADSALKLMHGTAAENMRKARMAERRSAVDDAGLIEGIESLGLGDIAERALKLGVALYVEGNLNGSIGSWSRAEVNGAIGELEYDNFELVEIDGKEEGDNRTGIVIRDAHKAKDKAAQGKGSVYRPSDTQANINMLVLGKLVQVHLNVA